MMWTTEKPTEPGFYWYRELYGCDRRPRVVDVVESKAEKGVLCEVSGIPLNYFTGEWILIPITPQEDAT